MKSLLLISRCPPYPLHLGDRLIVWHLATQLAARGWDIDLLAFAQYASDYRERGRYQHFFRSTELYAEPKRTQLAYLQRLRRPFPTQADEAWSPAMWRAIQMRLSERRYDAIHLFGGVQVYEFHGALGGLPAIITPYESYSLYLQRLIQQSAWHARARYSLQRLMAQRYERFMYAPYQQVVVLAEPDKQALLAANPRLNITVIPNGVDLADFPHTNKARRPATLLFTGNYEYGPNVDAAQLLATEIFPQVRARVPHASLWLVGHAPPPALQALQNDRIRVTGRVADIRPYLAEATVFVSPLRVGAGIKNKVLEAMAAGLPIVASPISADGIAARHGEEMLIAPPEAMAEMVIALLKDKTLQARLSAKGRELIQQRYTWARVASSYEGLYARLSVSF